MVKLVEQLNSRRREKHKDSVGTLASPAKLQSRGRLGYKLLMTCINSIYGHVWRLHHPQNEMWSSIHTVVTADVDK